MTAVARKVLAGCDIVACDAQAVADAAISYGVAPDVIARFAWGVDLVRFQPGGSRTLRAQLGWDQSFIVLSTRAHEPMYAMAVLIEAFRQAFARRSEMRMLVLGAGSQRIDLEASVAAAGLDSYVHFAGRVDQESLPAFYSAADCYASSSRVDGSSVSLLEAMACGLPAVATAIGGNPEWITPGETGWLVPVDDAEALGAALVEAASLRAEALAAMASAARHAVEDRADWRKNASVFTDAVAQAAAIGGSRSKRSAG